MKVKELPPLEVLQELFYTKEGKLYHKVNPRYRNLKDKEAGYLGTGGYFCTKINRETYLIHRILYCLYHNVTITPDEYIDHKNRDPLDNRKENLRIVSLRENCYNSSRKNKHNATGISFDKRCTNRPWRSAIYLEGKRHHIGSYATKEEAIEARLQAERDLGLYIYRE